MPEAHSIGDVATRPQLGGVEPNPKVGTLRDSDGQIGERNDRGWLPMAEGRECLLCRSAQERVVAALRQGLDLPTCRAGSAFYQQADGEFAIESFPSHHCVPCGFTWLQQELAQRLRAAVSRQFGVVVVGVGGSKQIAGMA